MRPGSEEVVEGMFSTPARFGTLFRSCGGRERLFDTGGRLAVMVGGVGFGWGVWLVIFEFCNDIWGGICGGIGGGGGCEGLGIRSLFGFSSVRGGSC